MAQEHQDEIQAAATTDGGSEFLALLGKETKTEPGSQREREIKQAVGTIVEHALKNSVSISDDAIRTINSIRSEIDHKLSEQLNEVMHHPDFQKLEGTWRGLHYLVSNTETGKDLKIKFLNISKDALHKSLKKFKNTQWDKSPLFRAVYEHEYGMLGGEPYGCLVGDYYFDHRAQDVETLGELAKIGAAAHCPFIAGASPSLLNCESWQELDKKQSVEKIFSTPDYAPWKSLRESEDSRYLGLAMPRFLSRLPFGARTEPVDEFDFEEDCDGSDHHKYVWSNSAYAMAANITRAFKEYGWCSRIRGIQSGGLVEELPCHTFPDLDGGLEMRCPTEVAIPDRTDTELGENGFMPLSHQKNTNSAAFIGARSIQKPGVFANPNDSKDAQLASSLPYLFASCRFAHYLKKMAYEWVGKYTSTTDMKTKLEEWINQYVDVNPDNSSEESKAKRPLRAAHVDVEEVEDRVGYYRAKFYLQPHYQLEGLKATLTLVSKIPSDKAAG